MFLNRNPEQDLLRLPELLELPEQELPEPEQELLRLPELPEQDPEQDLLQPKLLEQDLLQPELLEQEPELRRLTLQRPLPQYWHNLSPFQI